jgi:hypothetical protein
MDIIQQADAMKWMKAGEQQRMFSIIIRIGCFAVLFLSLFVNNAIALTYLDPNDKDKSIWFKRILNDSIPFHTGERVVIERKGVVSPWVVALIHLNYEEVRRQIEESVQGNFGIEDARETLTKAEEFKTIDLNIPEDPLFGPGFSGFRQLAPGMKSTREYTIVSKEFNHVPKVDGYSISRWRLGDGREILGQPWTIVVVERADFSREWARDHTGIIWPFKSSGMTRLVTETEIRLIEKLSGQQQVIIEYSVPYPAYKTGEVLELMKSIMGKVSRPPIP